MHKHLLLLLIGLAGYSFAAPAAQARVQCGAYTTREYRVEVDRSTAIFVGELIASVPRDDVPAGAVGARGADATFRVVNVIRGDLSAGDTANVYWRGFVESGDMRVGGCRVPELGGTEATRFLVLASGPNDALTVPNRTTSQRIGPSNRQLVQRIRRMSRR